MVSCCLHCTFHDWTCLSIFSGQLPSLPELFQFKVPQHVGVNYKIFGTFLLDDKTGSRVDNIKKTCFGDPEDIVAKILQEWITGKGKALSWEMLIKTLRDCELTVLADQMQDTLS